MYFGEDDYLYEPHTFGALEHAAEALPHVDHFAPYGTIGHTMPNGEPLHAGLKRPRRTPRRLAEVDGVWWHRATSHTVSFAIRVRALREDRTLHMLTLKASGAWDHTMCLACQGIVPYTRARARRTAARPHRRVHEPAGEDRRLAPGAQRTRAAAAPPSARDRGASPALASHMEVGLTAQQLDVHSVT